LTWFRYERMAMFGSVPSVLKIAKTWSCWTSCRVFSTVFEESSASS